MFKFKTGHTVAACFFCYVTQAIINNFAPLLFLTFHETYGISLTLIGTMITVNFGIQLLVDLLASKFADKIGYRKLIVAAHALAASGLILLAVLPRVAPHPVAGLFTAAAVYAVGGGLIEVLVSPIVEACPYDNKKSMMSLLHSFYCWGQVGVVAFSSLYFFIFGIENWHILAFVWAAVPLLNAVLFAFVPIYQLNEGGESFGLRKLLSSGSFLLFALLMVCAGSSETAISQWASAFAESGLGISKTLGDLAGPCMFGALMGISRVIFSKFGEKINLRAALLVGAAGSAVGYALCAFSPVAWLGLVGCAVVGLSVGVMWPGTFSLASASIPAGGTAMFALLALAGDLGCAAGPSAVGTMADVFGNDLQIGIAFGLIFPVLMFFVLLFYRKNPSAEKNLTKDSRFDEFCGGRAALTENDFSESSSETRQRNNETMYDCRDFSDNAANGTEIQPPAANGAKSEDGE